MGRAGRTNAWRSAWPALALAGVVATGCTMCPDPYDYSGPVPNGSAPQNDFRARSNGILPLGAAPAPWPLIVHREAGRGEAGRGPGTPTLADDEDGGVIDDTIAAPAEPASILVTGGVEAEEQAPESDAGRGDPWRVVPTFPADADAPAELLETPGWRPRSGR